MGGREPGEPDGKKVFADAERPIGKRFGNGVGGGARAGFGAVRGEGDSTGEERGDPAPLGTETRRDSEGENGCGGRANESVEKIPDRVEVRNFVGEKFKDVESDGEAENDGVGEDVEFVGEMNHVEAFEETESGDGGVKIEAGREAGAEGEGDGLERIHGWADIQFNCGGVGAQRDCGSKKQKQIPNPAESAGFGMTLLSERADRFIRMNRKNKSVGLLRSK